MLPFIGNTHCDAPNLFTYWICAFTAQLFGTLLTVYSTLTNNRTDPIQDQTQPMLETISEAGKLLSLICTSLALIGCLYALVASFLVRRFASRANSSHPGQSSVTILKPLYGAEVNLESNLASFCNQIYDGEVQILFGVQSPQDPAISVVSRLIEAFPDKNLRLIVDATQHGTNRKVSNLINMARYIEHDIVVLADSDMRVEPDYLGHLAAALQADNVGVVTCLYRGNSAAGFWSHLSAMAIEFHFLPSVIMGLALGLARPCFGSTIALRRETLDKIGGFKAFADQLADDYAIGEAVLRLGQKIAIPAFLVAHTCPERSFGELFRHELRWARTISVVDPLGFIGSGVTHALPFASIAALLRGFDMLGCGLIALALASRLILQLEVSRDFKLRWAYLWLAPMRDFFSFMVYLACFMTSRIDWRGQSFTVNSDGTLVPSASNQQEK